MTKKKFPEGFFTKDRPIANPKYLNAEDMLNNYEADCEVYENNGDSLDTESWMTDYLKNHPSADVQPVVHCKDCKFYKNYGIGYMCYSDFSSSYVNTAIRKPLDYCSHGAKMDGDEHDK